MDERRKYFVGFYAICAAFALSLMATTLWMTFAHLQRLNRLLPVEAIVAFFALFWWIRRFRGRIMFSQKQLTKAARSARNLGILYIAAPVLAYLTQGSTLISLPYGLGFWLPIFPLALAVHYLRLSARLQRQSSMPEATEV